MNVLGTLGLDWKLFIAQLVNFAIVLVIFWKWIVKPLAKNLTDRQSKIESGIKNAEYMEKEKENFEQWRMNEMRKTRDEADKILKIAILDAEKVKTDTVIETHEQTVRMLEQAKISMDAQKQRAMREIREDVATLVVAASEKILRHKLDEKKDHALVSESIQEVVK
ncbi:MAG TPA: F0F1 ATP synthase subunit B [Patescibacteria group bacterium]|nr:F0F1 ATP synthase subunit B [Patescibacteria group bacterium]